MIKIFMAKEAKKIDFSKDEIDKRYKQIRKELIISTFLAYVVFFLTRKNFIYSMPKMLEVAHFSIEEFGLINSFFYIIFAISKLLSGLISDKLNPKAVVGPSLIIIGIINLAFASSTNFLIFIFLYSLNAIFQGFGFLPLTKIFANWFSKKERGRWYSLWELSHSVGGILSPLITSFCISISNSWQMGFIIPGIISIIIGIICLKYLKDTPESEGLPNIAEYKNDKLELDQIKNSPSNLSTKDIVLKYILKNPFVWLGIFGDFGICIIQTIISDWTSIYYTKVLGFNLISANSLLSYFEIGGVIGILSAGIVSDCLFSGNRWLSSAFYMLILFISFCFLKFIGHNFILVGFVFILIGISLHASSMLYSIGLIEITHKNGVCAVTGIKGFITYLGASIAGYPLALIKNSFGWSGVGILIGLICILILFSLLILSYKKS